MIIPKLEELINKRKNNNNNKQKVQLSIDVNFININDKEITRTFYVRSDNEEIMLGNDTSDINKILESLLNNYQKEEQILRGGSDYIFESIDILGVHFYNIKLKRGKSYIESPEWISSKKPTINPKNTKDNKCFQYVITVALNHKEINNHPERISKIKPFISNYNWKDIHFPAGIDDWKKFERNIDIALKILSVPPSEKKKNIIYKSKYNRKRKNQVVLLMITDNEQQDTIEKWHYITLKSEITDDGYKNQHKAYLDYSEISHQTIMEIFFA